MAEVTFSEEQQALVDKLVGEARVKSRSKAETDFQTQLAKDNDAAVQANLVAEKEWQKLAATHEARVKQLEPFEAQAKAYGELVTGMLKARVKALGDAAKKAVAALPDSLSDLDKLNWLNENGALFQEVGDGVGTPGRTRQVKPTPDRPKIKTRFGPIKL